MIPLATSFWLRHCDQVGAGTSLAGRPSISNQGRLVLGARFLFVSVPVQSHLVVGPGAELVIGDDVSIGHGAAIAAHASIRIGPGTRIGPFVSIADTDFHVAGVKDAHAKPEVTPITLGRDVRLGSRVTILRGAVVGDGAIVLAGSVVSGEVPAGATVGGVPARPVGALAAADDAPVAERVARVVASALGHGGAPELEARLVDLEGWDSLAALRTLLSLEESFAVTLDEKSVPRARRVSDLVALVEAALQHSRKDPA